jgi:hypothetical protein
VAGDYAYLGSGSAELANWARAVLVLREVGPDLYELRAAKRGRRSGLSLADGTASTEIFLRQSTRGICWQRDEPHDEERHSDDETLAEMVIAAMRPGIVYSRGALVEVVRESLNVSKTSVLSSGRRPNRVFRLVLDRTKQPERPQKHLRP